jgi:predicted kinase
MTRRQDDRPAVFLLCGPSLAGKSTVAEMIRRELSATVICADEINSERGLPFGGEGLPESAWAETLRIQVERFHEAMRLKHSVVIDDTLCYRWLRDRWRQEAAKAGVPAALLLLTPSKEDLLSRHQALGQSNRRPVLSMERFLEHLSAFEWPTPEEEAVLVKTPAQLQAWLKTD